MIPLLIAAPDLPLAATGGPSLLLLPGVDPAAFDLPGVAPWCVAPPAEDGAPHRLHRPGADPAAATLALPALPAGVLAILAAKDVAEAAPLLGLWQGSAAPPVLAPAATPAAVLPALARLLAGELAARLVETAQAQRGLVRLREEAEATREAMAALLQASGLDAPAPPVLALSAEPGAARLAAAQGRLHVAQRLGTSLQGLSAIALHLAEASLAEPDKARLAVRLFGAESGRVRGAWTLPGAALRPGWLVLDLPRPLGPLRESACLEVAAEIAPTDALTLSLEDREAPPDRAAQVAAGEDTPGRAALALRLWTAAFGRRFVLAPHWDWEAQDVPLGLPQRLPDQAWAGLRVLAGQGGPLALGAGPPRPVMTLTAEAREALLLLPAVPLAGIDLVEAEVTVPLGEADALEAALWALPEASLPLSLEAPGARCTGWRPAEAAQGGMTLALRLPPGGLGPAPAAVALALRHRGTPASGPLRVEWADLLGRRLLPDLPPPPPDAAESGPPSPALLAAAPRDAVPALEGEVRLQECYVMEGGQYRHLDIRVDGLRLGTLSWPRVRFKFAVNGAAGPQIEIRARPDWPAMFERWPGSAADEHGPYLLLTGADRGGRGLARLRTARDRLLLQALLPLLPTLVATAARAATPDAAEYADWVAMARRLAAALMGGGEEGETGWGTTG